MITKEYKLKLKNSNLIQLLLDKDNISPLESILDNESQYLKKIQNLKDSQALDFGPKLNKVDLKVEFSGVKEEVDRFLGVSDVAQPSCDYYSIFKPDISTVPLLGMYGFGALCTIEGLLKFPYDPANAFFGIILLQNAFFLHIIERGGSRYNLLTRSIIMSPLHKYRADVIPVVGHEYAHHVQRRKLSLPLLPKRSYFDEGHARGVQRFIANSYRNKENNEAFMYDYLDLSVAELRVTYQWMCKKLEIAPSKSLLKIETATRYRKQTGHSIGNTLFLLYETRLGKGIYKDLIDGSFEFKKVY